MATPLVAAGATAFAFYAYYRQRTSGANAIDGHGRALSVETHARVEHPPNTWSEALYVFTEALRYMYHETLGRWHTLDLFFGLAYLSQRGTSEYAASDLAAKGTPFTAEASPMVKEEMLVHLKEIRRYLLYCKGLKLRKPALQLKFWQENLGIEGGDIVAQEPYAGLLRPAHVIIRDRELQCIVLCIRGTHSLKDLFTSLTGAVKPHHLVQQSGVVIGYSHLGMLAAARWLLRATTPTLREALAANPGYSLRIVGHSMGGGTAAMLTMMLRDQLQIPELRDALCYAVACPACMTLELAHGCREYVTSILNGTDVVPSFCAGSVDVLREHVVASTWFADMQRDIRLRVSQAVNGSIRGVGNATSWTGRTLQRPVRACYTPVSQACPRPTPDAPSDHLPPSGPFNPYQSPPVMEAHADGGAGPDDSSPGGRGALQGAMEREGGGTDQGGGQMDRGDSGSPSSSGRRGGMEQEGGAGGRGWGTRSVFNLWGSLGRRQGGQGLSEPLLDEAGEGVVGEGGRGTGEGGDAADGEGVMLGEEARGGLPQSLQQPLQQQPHGEAGMQMHAGGGAGGREGGLKATSSGSWGQSVARVGYGTTRLVGSAVGNTSRFVSRRASDLVWGAGIFGACKTGRRAGPLGIGEGLPERGGGVEGVLEGDQPPGLIAMGSGDEEGEEGEVVGVGFSAGITEVVAAVTSEGNSRALQEEEAAAKSILEEMQTVQGPDPSCALVDPYLTPPHHSRTSSVCDSLPAADDLNKLAAAAEGEQEGGEGGLLAEALGGHPEHVWKRKLYPAGRIMHFFPVAAFEQGVGGGVDEDPQVGGGVGGEGGGGVEDLGASKGSAAADLGDVGMTDVGQGGSGVADVGMTDVRVAGVGVAAALEVDEVGVTAADVAAGAEGARLGDAMQAPEGAMEGSEGAGNGGPGQGVDGEADNGQKQGVGGQEAGAAGAAKRATKYVLCEGVPNEAYGRVKLCSTMVLDHFIPSYVVALDSVVAQLEESLGRVVQGGAPVLEGGEGAMGAGAAAAGADEVGMMAA